MKTSHGVAEATGKVTKSLSYHRSAHRALGELQAALAASNGWEGYSQAQHVARQSLRVAVAAQQVEVDARLAEWQSAEHELVRAEFLGHTVVAGFKARRAGLGEMASQWWVAIGELEHRIDAGVEACYVSDQVRDALAGASLPRFLLAEDPDDEFYATLDELVLGLLSRSVRTDV